MAAMVDHDHPVLLGETGPDPVPLGEDDPASPWMSSSIGAPSGPASRTTTPGPPRTQFVPRFATDAPGVGETRADSGGEGPPQDQAAISQPQLPHTSTPAHGEDQLLDRPACHQVLIDYPVQ